MSSNTAWSAMVYGVKSGQGTKDSRLATMPCVRRLHLPFRHVVGSPHLARSKCTSRCEAPGGTRWISSYRQK